MKEISEVTLTWLVPMRLFAVIVFSTLYVVSGRGYIGKWCRRWLAPALYLGICALITYFVEASYWKLSPLLALPAVLILPYTNKDGFGWARRLLYGTLFGGIGLAMGFMYGLWYIGLWQMLMAILASMVLGLLNPVEAVNEEALIATLSVMFIPFMIR